MALTLDDIKYFHKVSQTLNVTRASEQLGITQPTLSYAIKRLESELGGDLLIRLKSGIQLTKFGEMFLETSGKIIFEWENAQSLINPENTEQKGEYKIGIHPSVGLDCLHIFLPAVTKKYPNITFKLFHGLSREMAEKIVSWEVDFGVIVNPIAHPDFLIKNLTKDRVTLYAVKGAQEKLILDPDMTQAQYIIKKLKSKTLSTNNMITTNNLEIIMQLTSSGLGYGLLPESIAKQNPKLIPLKGAPFYNDEICLVYRQDKHSKNMVSKFIFDQVTLAYK
jgi:DNA-binding transcriptional LysR family regulator